MTDERSSTEKDEAQSGDSPLQRRSSDSSGSDIRSFGKRGKGLAANRSGAPDGDELAKYEEVLAAEILDQMRQLMMRLLNQFLKEHDPSGVVNGCSLH